MAILPDVLFQILDASGSPVPSGTATFYLTGTTTLATIYANAEETSALANPLTADSVGLLPTAYLPAGVPCRMVLKDALGTTLADIDPVNPTPSVAQQPSRASATLQSFPASNGYVRTAGYAAAGDGGAGLYKRVGSEPAHGAKFQSADGAWWELVPENGVGNPLQMGGKLNDDTAKAANNTAFGTLLAWCSATGASPDLLSGIWHASAEVRLPTGSATGGDVTIDMRTAASVDCPSGAAVRVDAGDITSLPALADSPVEGTVVMTFVSAHGLAVGDGIAVYDPTDFSFNPWRDYYRAGQWNRVASVVSSTQIITQYAMERSYDHAVVTVGKRPGKTWSWAGGRLAILGSTSVPTAFLLNNLDNCGVDRLTVRHGQRASFITRRCFGVTGKGVRIEQTHNSGFGEDYGYANESSSLIDLQGEFHGRRHAVSTGPSIGPWAVPIFDHHVAGKFSNDPTADQPALDTHGNTERYIYSGTVQGGLIYSGNKGTFRLDIEGRTLGGARASAIAGEWHGCDFDFSATSFRSSALGDPYAAVGHAVVDLGGNGTGFTLKNSGTTDDATTNRGGVINLAGATIDCRGHATRPILMANRGLKAGDGQMIVDLSGLRILNGVPGWNVIADISGGYRAVDVLLCGRVDGAFWVVQPDTRVRSWRSVHEEAFVASGSVISVTGNVSWNARAPKDPPVGVYVMFGDASGTPIDLAAADLVTQVTARSATGATIKIARRDGVTNIPAGTYSVVVSAALEE